ncbi:MAG: helix-turn-helix domain-containing protein [Salibacteraceae bacterium]
MKSKIEIKDKIQPSRSFKISPFRKNIRKTNPHKHHSYFEIIFLSAGTGFHTIDDQPYEIVPNTLFIVRQDQVHYWDITSDPEGYVILIKRPLVDQSHDPDLKQIFATLSAQTHTVSLQPQFLENILELLLTEYEKENSNTIIIEGLLKALLYKISESRFSKSIGFGHSTNSTYQKFVNAITENILNHHQVKYYAQMLHTTPQNLNAICQKETQKSASAVISDYLITEAKRNLTYTDNPVVEIAHSLGFKDDSHFVKFFKRHTQSTPKNYRKGTM